MSNKEILQVLVGVDYPEEVKSLYYDAPRTQWYITVKDSTKRDVSNYLWDYNVLIPILKKQDSQFQKEINYSDAQELAILLTKHIKKCDPASEYLKTFHPTIFKESEKLNTVWLEYSADQLADFIMDAYNTGLKDGESK